MGGGRAKVPAETTGIVTGIDGLALGRAAVLDVVDGVRLRWDGGVAVKYIGIGFGGIEIDCLAGLFNLGSLLALEDATVEDELSFDLYSGRKNDVILLSFFRMLPLTPALCSL